MAEPKQLQLQVEGLRNLMEKLNEHKGKRIIIMFIGSMDDNGDSWCPDCRDAEPAVECALKTASSDIVFILVVVGDKPEWKAADNEFRTSEFKLKEVPTLIEYGTDRRLGCDECKKQDLVAAFFEKY